MRGNEICKQVYIRNQIYLTFCCSFYGPGRHLVSSWFPFLLLHSFWWSPRGGWGVGFCVGLSSVSLLISYLPFNIWDTGDSFYIPIRDLTSGLVGRRHLTLIKRLWFLFFSSSFALLSPFSLFFCTFLLYPSPPFPHSPFIIGLLFIWCLHGNNSSRCGEMALHLIMLASLFLTLKSKILFYNFRHFIEVFLTH